MLNTDVRAGLLSRSSIAHHTTLAFIHSSIWVAIFFSIELSRNIAVITTELTYHRTLTGKGKYFSICGYWIATYTLFTFIYLNSYELTLIWNFQVTTVVKTILIVIWMICGRIWTAMLAVLHNYLLMWNNVDFFLRLNYDSEYIGKLMVKWFIAFGYFKCDFLWYHEMEYERMNSDKVEWYLQQKIYANSDYYQRK